MVLNWNQVNELSDPLLVTDKIITFRTPEGIELRGTWQDVMDLVKISSGLTTADIPDTTDKRYVTDADLEVLAVTSGINTGDETTASIKTKLGVADASDDGYLLSADWNTFNNKLDKSQAAHTMQANNTNATANVTDQVFKDIAAQAITSGVPTWTAGTPPSGTESHQYTWTQVGKMVTLFFYLTYVTPGATCTAVAFPLPSDMPAPLELSGTGAALDYLYMGSGYIGTAKGTSPAVMSRVTLRVNAADTGYEVFTTGTSVSARVCWGTVQYKAA